MPIQACVTGMPCRAGSALHAYKPNAASAGPKCYLEGCAAGVSACASHNTLVRSWRCRVGRLSPASSWQSSQAQAAKQAGACPRRAAMALRMLVFPLPLGPHTSNPPGAGASALVSLHLQHKVVLSSAYHLWACPRVKVIVQRKHPLVDIPDFRHHAEDATRLQAPRNSETHCVRVEWTSKMFLLPHGQFASCPFCHAPVEIPVQSWEHLMMLRGQIACQPEEMAEEDTSDKLLQPDDHRDLYLGP